MTAQEAITKIKAEVERLKKEEQEELKDMKGVLAPTLKSISRGKIDAFDDLLSFLNTLEETSYDTQKYAPSPSVSIEDVARVQFASHAKVIEKKRKAIFDWEQFKEVAGIFHGFGKKDSSDTLEEPVCEELEEARRKECREYINQMMPDTMEAVSLHFTKFGAKWQKEQMMKDAVKGTYNNSDWGTPCIDLQSPLELERFDKVRIIIIKECEK